MIRHEMIELLGWRYQDMTEAQQDVLSRVENIVEVAVLRERDKTICAAELLRLQAQRDALLEALKMMAEIIDKMGDMPDGFIHPSPWQTLKCEETLKQARAAIKAAEGEKQ